MSTNGEEADPLLINGLAVDRRLLEARPIRRCHLDECHAHCCGYGVWLRVEQAEDILAHRDLILPHMPADRRDPSHWFDDERTEETDHPQGGTLTGTSVVPDPTHPTGSNCVFLRPDRKCALQVASVAAGEHPWRFKPFYCALHPLTFDRKVLTLDDTNPLYTAGGSCNRTRPGDPVPVYALFDMEMKLAVGEAGYQEVVAHACDGR